MTSARHVKCKLNPKLWISSGLQTNVTLYLPLQPWFWFLWNQSARLFLLWAPHPLFEMTKSPGVCSLNSVLSTKTGIQQNTCIWMKLPLYQSPIIFTPEQWLVQRSVKSNAMLWICFHWLSLHKIMLHMACWIIREGEHSLHQTWHSISKAGPVHVLSF